MTVATLTETETGRTITFDEAAHVPGSIFITLRRASHPASTKPPALVSCFEVPKGDLIIALRDMFGLVDPLEALLTH